MRKVATWVAKLTERMVDYWVERMVPRTVLKMVVVKAQKMAD